MYLPQITTLMSLNIYTWKIHVFYRKESRQVDIEISSQECVPAGILYAVLVVYV